MDWKYWSDDLDWSVIGDRNRNERVFGSGSRSGSRSDFRSFRVSHRMGCCPAVSQNCNVREWYGRETVTVIIRRHSIIMRS